MRIRSWSPLVAVAASALVLAGCSSTEEGNAEAGTPTPSETTSEVAPESEVAEDEEADASDTGAEPAGEFSGEFTPQGTELALGEPAYIPFKYADSTGVVSVTLDAIDKGDPSDLDPLDMGDQVAGLVPYYLRYTVTNESGDDLAFSSLGGTRGILPDGSRAQDLTIIFGNLDQCDGESAGSDFTEVGASYQACDISLAPEATEVAGLEIWRNDRSDEVPGTDYSAEPVRWWK
ncbi:hypothetical protein [Actinoalloteichus spitiensis]|uniref:hypothetical protein n=1 Tax=Actinoalloteichus spitiensis TaxID=252394 RepID=UPI0003800A18|nr:hypothetical protein [Actinoalloteichus spitiensis]